MVILKSGAFSRWSVGQTSTWAMAWALFETRIPSSPSQQNRRSSYSIQIFRSYSYTVLSTSLCQSATKIGKFTNRQLYQSANLPIGNFPIGKNQSANLPKRNVTNRQTNHLANIPLSNISVRQHYQLAILQNGNLEKWQTYNSAISRQF